MMRASVIATVRGEPVERLQRMVDSIAAQSIGPIELVVAAPPGDRRALESLQPFGALALIVIVDNPNGGRSAGLNLAANAATASVLHRVDARSVIARDHVERCDARLASDERVAAVGGRQQAVPATAGALAVGMVRALANPWVMGGAAYRRPGATGPVDTVYLGSFRRDELLALGGYDEALAANEDFDLCQRFRQRGGIVWLEADLVVAYESRVGVRDVWRQYETFGRSKVAYWRARRERPNARQAVGLAAPVLALLAPLAVRRVAPVAAMTIAFAATLMALDQLAVGGRPRPNERAVAAFGAVVIPAAWASGAYREWLAPRLPAPRARRRKRAAAVAAPQPAASTR